MLAFLEILLNDGGKPRILKEVTGETVQRRCPPRDGGGEESAARLQDPSRLAEGASTIGSLDQVIEWAQEQDDVGALSGEAQGPRLTDSAGGERLGPGRTPPLGFSDQPRHRVD
jgi:hypothetical protein